MDVLAVIKRRSVGHSPIGHVHAIVSLDGGELRPRDVKYEPTDGPRDGPIGGLSPRGLPHRHDHR